MKITKKLIAFSLVLIINGGLYASNKKDENQFEEKKQLGGESENKIKNKPLNVERKYIKSTPKKHTKEYIEREHRIALYRAIYDSTDVAVVGALIKEAKQDMVVSIWKIWSQNERYNLIKNLSNVEDAEASKIFSKKEFYNYINNLIQNKKNSEAPKNINVKDFFKYITGVKEKRPNLAKKLTYSIKNDSPYNPLGTSYTPNGTTYITNSSTGEEFRAGTFEVLSLKKLRELTKNIDELDEKNASGTFNVIISKGKPSTANPHVDIAMLLANPDNANAAFVGTSNFDCREGINAEYNKVSDYPTDPTQGPRMSNNAGAILRDHLVKFSDGTIGQTVDEKWVKPNTENHPEIALFKDQNVEIKNGYLKFSKTNAPKILNRLENLKNDFHIGYQKGVQVIFGKDHNHKAWTLKGKYEVLNNQKQIVDQIYVAALNLDSEWKATPQCKESKTIAKLILKYSYESILRACAAQGIKKVYLPLIGCGVFENKPKWVISILNDLAGFIKKSGIKVVLNLFCEKNSKEKNTYKKSFLNDCEKLVKKTDGDYTIYESITPIK